MIYHDRIYDSETGEYCHRYFLLVFHGICLSVIPYQRLISHHKDVLIISVGIGVFSGVRIGNLKTWVISDIIRECWK